MKLIVISGRSGSGKSTALNALEDEGFSCIDNFPADLLPQLVQSKFEAEITQDLAVCIDARNVPKDLEQLPQRLNALDQIDLKIQVIFLDALADTLIQRFRNPPSTPPHPPLPRFTRGYRHGTRGSFCRF